MSMYKLGGASTLTVVNAIKAMVPLAAQVAAAGNHHQGAV